MSGLSLTTADIDQAFEACSASAVLPAWKHISQSCESRFSSNSVLVRRGRREVCKPGRSQSFWSRMVFDFNSGHGQGVIPFHVGNVGVHGMADQGCSNWWGHELGCRCGVVGCGGACLVGSATEALTPLDDLSTAPRHARVGALRPMPFCLGIGSTWVGPGRTPTVHPCCSHPARQSQHGSGAVPRSTAEHGAGELQIDQRQGSRVRRAARHGGAPR